MSYEDGRLASATSLFYEYLVEEGMMQRSNSLTDFVELVRQYDTWEWDANENQKAKQLNDLFYLVSINEFEERMVKRLTVTNSDVFEFDEFERRLLEMEADKIERYIRRKGREIVQQFIGDYCTGIVHAESYHSELGNALGKEHPHLDYIAILGLGNKKISFRTIHDDVDVSAIAGRFGGGGHAKAAGCPLDKDGFKLYVEEIFPLNPIRPDASRNVYNLRGTIKGCYYASQDGGHFCVYGQSEKRWFVERNGLEIEIHFPSFNDAERHIKRHYGAFLTKDDAFVDFLINHCYNVTSK